MKIFWLKSCRKTKRTHTLPKSLVCRSLKGHRSYCMHHQPHGRDFCCAKANRGNQHVIWSSSLNSFLTTGDTFYVTVWLFLAAALLGNLCTLYALNHVLLRHVLSLQVPIFSTLMPSMERQQRCKIIRIFIQYFQLTWQVIVFFYSCYGLSPGNDKRNGISWCFIGGIDQDAIEKNHR